MMNTKRFIASFRSTRDKRLKCIDRGSFGVYFKCSNKIGVKIIERTDDSGPQTIYYTVTQLKKSLLWRVAIREAKYIGQVSKIGLCQKVYGVRPIKTTIRVDTYCGTKYQVGDGDISCYLPAIFMQHIYGKQLNHVQDNIEIGNDHRFQWIENYINDIRDRIVQQCKLLLHDLHTGNILVKIKDGKVIDTKVIDFSPCTIKEIA